MDTTLTIRIPKELKQALHKIAAADSRKLSDYLRLHLQNLVAQSKKKGK